MLYLTIFFTFDAIFLSDTIHIIMNIEAKKKKLAKSMQPATETPKKIARACYLCNLRLHLRPRPLFLL
jgi:hypothetical protein